MSLLGRVSEPRPFLGDVGSNVVEQLLSATLRQCAERRLEPLEVIVDDLVQRHRGAHVHFTPSISWSTASRKLRHWGTNSLSARAPSVVKR